MTAGSLFRSRASTEHARALRECREILEQNSKSFALAARLLPASGRDQAAALYAFCRRVDDAIDDAPPDTHEAALQALHEELDQVYGGASLGEPALRAFRAVVEGCELPRQYPAELIEGMAMDVRNTRYETLEDLLRYCHCVAGVVGLMMCHVFGITRDDALLNAAHLGIAMQLTNICRDVQEDWGLGRLYLPRELLEAAGAEGLVDHPAAAPFPSDAASIAAFRSVTEQLLAEADRYYRSADRGIQALPFRAGLAVRAARQLYHAIGLVVAEQDHDPRRGRAVVPKAHKLVIVGRALKDHVAALPAYTAERVRLTTLRSHAEPRDSTLRAGAEPRALTRARTPQRRLQFPEDVLI